MSLISTTSHDTSTSSSDEDPHECHLHYNNPELGRHLLR